MSFTLRARVAGMLALATALAGASPACADTLTVTQLQDDGPGSLREAVAQANAKRTLELLVSSSPERQVQIKEAIAKNKKTIDDALNTLEQMVYLP